MSGYIRNFKGKDKERDNKMSGYVKTFENK